jgi:hypothetical protein
MKTEVPRKECSGIPLPCRRSQRSLTTAMKHIAVILSLFAFALASASMAKDPKKPIKDVPLPDVVVDEAAVALLKPFDKDGNYEIDKTEFVALAAAYKADPNGPLKQFDLSKTGELDDFVDRAKINNILGAVQAKKDRDAAELKRQKRVEKMKEKAAAEKNSQ